MTGQLSSPTLQVRDASEAVAAFLREHCNFATSRDSKIVEVIELYVRMVTERSQEVALEFEVKSGTGRTLPQDSEYDEYYLRNPQALVAFLEVILPLNTAEIRIRRDATKLTSRFGDNLVLRASLDFASFGGKVIWRRTNFAVS